nr:CotH kinase family protein [Clostridiales bacterium]
KKENYVKGVYTLVSDGTGIVEQPLSIKGRGNYSWSFPQKPYTVKLDSGEPLLGMDKGKKWVLVTTYSDKTLLRNYMTLNLSSRLLGMRYSVEAEYVDVYMDWEYNGLYALSEKVALGQNRCDADALFEIEAQYRHGDCSNCIICPSGCHLMLKEVRNDVDDKEWASLLKYYGELIKNADKAMKKGSDEYLKYIDVESFVDWYIVNELVKNYDSGFTTSCYFCVKDDKLYMGPCWDYDTCMGNQIVAECVKPVGYHVANSPWYSMLLGDEYFLNALYSRWTQLWNDGVFDTFVRMLDETASVIADSERLDHKKYPAALTNHDLRGDMSRETWEGELDYLKDWVNTRLEWLNSEWNEAYDHEDSALMLVTGTGAKYLNSETRKLFESLDNLTASSGVSRISGTIDGYGDESVDKAFDGNYATKYCWPCNGESEIQFRTGDAISPTHYALMTANDTSSYTHRNPQKWKIYGSNDLSSWDLLTEVGDGRSILASADFTWHVFKLDNPGSYRYFKIWISNDDIVQFSEIALLG